MDNNTFCPNCFKSLPVNTTVCGYCGFNLTSYQPKPSALPLYTVLNSQYIIGKVLGQGGFGITYKAYDTFKQQIVAIKEYMPSDYSERRGKTVYPLADNSKANKIFEHGKNSYIAEIKTLYQFESVPGIVKIFSHFQENNTAYLVMEFLDGYSLRSYVKAKGGKISVAEATRCILDVAKSLSVVHKAHILHRDISPENIFLSNDGHDVKLLDFGSARHYIENSEEELSVLLKPGFAPPEQYSRTGNQGPWTDIYALAATFYYIGSGSNVPDSISRMQSDTLQPLNLLVPQVSKAMAGALVRAMEVDCKKRTQSCEQFIQDLKTTGWLNIPTNAADLTPSPVRPTPTPTPTPPPSPPQMRQILCRVACVFGDGKGRYRDFSPGQRIVVGRNVPPTQYCDLEASREKFVSKRHCVVEYDIRQQCFFVTDLSQNGTFTGRGRRLKRGVREMLPNNSIVFLAKENVIIQFNAYYV